MSEVQKLKQARTTAKRLFTRAKSSLSRAIHTGIESDVQLQIIENRFTDLRKAWNAVQEKHEQYILQLDETDVDKIRSEDEWMAEIDSEYDHAEAQKLDYIRERENAKKEVSQNENTTANSKEVHQPLRRRNIEEATFIYQIENLDAILVSESQKGESMVKMIKEAHSELLKQFETCKEAHNRYVGLVDLELPKEEINWIASHMNKLSQMNIKVATILSEKDVNKRPVGLRLKKMKMPFFNRDIREFKFQIKIQI